MCEQFFFFTQNDTDTFRFVFFFYAREHSQSEYIKDSPFLEEVPSLLL